MQVRQSDPVNIGPMPSPLSEAQASEVKAYFDYLRAQADATQDEPAADPAQIN